MSTDNKAEGSLKAERSRTNTTIQAVAGIADRTACLTAPFGGHVTISPQAIWAFPIGGPLEPSLYL